MAPYAYYPSERKQVSNSVCTESGACRRGSSLKRRYSSRTFRYGYLVTT